MIVAPHTGHMSPSTPSTTSHEPYLDQLAHLIAEHGVHAFEGDIARLVVRLRAAGHHSPLIGLLADRHAAPVARQRAFGHLVGLLLADRAPVTACATRAA
jgi:hypothetical protein